MKAIVIGLGSMGRRRIRLLGAVDPSVEIVGIDTQKGRRLQAESELKIETAGSIGEAITKSGRVDISFISTPPLSHASIIEECLNNGSHVFTEMNLTDNGYDRNIAKANAKEKVLFLSSTFLYRKEVDFIKSRVSSASKPLTYNYHSGQYLPDWHPWESYKDFFIWNKETNGCREIMAIEFPWLIDVFGPIVDLHTMHGRQSALDIDFPDNYQIMFEHGSGHKGMVSIDVVSRKAVRNFELSGEELYLTWDGTPAGLYGFNLDTKEAEKIKLYGSVEKRTDYASSIIEDAYRYEIEDFLNAVMGLGKPKYSFEQDKIVLGLINEIEGD